MGEAAEDVLEDGLDAAGHVGGFEEGDGIVVWGLGPALGDGGEAEGELGLCQRPFENLGAGDAGFWAPDGCEWHANQVIINVSGNKR